ncbi:hypothetical protein PENSPDRAFT_433762 [Peniophora sp. CONT]|nr:hypothetical protein PENSPDRAFT_433762 [Peniophora sp. CONT]
MLLAFCVLQQLSELTIDYFHRWYSWREFDGASWCPFATRTSRSYPRAARTRSPTHRNIWRAGPPYVCTPEHCVRLSDLATEILLRLARTASTRRLEGAPVPSRCLRSLLAQHVPRSSKLVKMTDIWHSYSSVLDHAIVISVSFLLGSTGHREEFAYERPCNPTYTSQASSWKGSYAIWRSYAIWPDD